MKTLATLTLLSLLVACNLVLDIGDKTVASRCSQNLTLCATENVSMCVDLASDPMHCGGCDTACASGICLDGVCCVGEGARACAQDGKQVCVDPASDPMHCGGCGNVCKSGVCTNGACCDGDSPMTCWQGDSAQCVDTFWSDAHCGTCGTTCNQGACIEGNCCRSPCLNACLPARFERQMAIGDVEGIGSHGVDLDLDGYGDLVFSHQLTGTMHVYWGNPRGTLTQRTVISAGRIGAGLGVGDMDGDGLLDLVTAIQGQGPPYGDRIRIFRGKGKREFQPPTDVMQNDNPGWLTVLDADHDGHADVVVRLPGRNCTALRRGDGKGGLAAAECLFDYATISDEEPIRSADVTGDKKVDLVDGRRDGIFVHELNDDGSVARTTQLRDTPSAFGLHDLDGDGVSEVVSFLLAEPTWSFTLDSAAPKPHSLCKVPESITLTDALNTLGIRGVTDFDGDHVIDFVGTTTCGECTSNLYLELGRLAAPCDALGTCPVQ